MQATVQLLYKGIPLIVTYDYRGEPRYFMEHPLFQEPLAEVLYIDDLTASSDKAINDLLHELLGQSEDFLKAVLLKAQETCRSDIIERRITASPLRAMGRR